MRPIALITEHPSYILNWHSVMLLFTDFTDLFDRDRLYIYEMWRLLCQTRRSRAFTYIIIMNNYSGMSSGILLKIIPLFVYWHIHDWIIFWKIFIFFLLTEALKLLSREIWTNRYNRIIIPLSNWWRVKWRFKNEWINYFIYDCWMNEWWTYEWVNEWMNYILL